MPTRDPKLCPSLERAMPSDSVPGSSVIPSRPERLEVLFGDGLWHPASVRARRGDRHGRAVVALEWSAAGEMWSESYLADPEKMREAG